MPKKERYRLEPLLKLKERQKRKAEVILAKAITSLEEEKEKLQGLQDIKTRIIEQRQKARHNMREKISTGQSRIKESQFYEGYMRKLKEDEEKIIQEIEEQKGVIEFAEEKLKRARRDYLDAASEMNTMEKHKELWAKKLQKALTALESKQMNELGNTVYQMNRGRG